MTYLEENLGRLDVRWWLLRDHDLMLFLARSKMAVVELSAQK